VPLLKNAGFGTGHDFRRHKRFILIPDLGELHQLFAFKFEQSHTHVGNFSVLEGEILLSNLLDISKLRQFSKVMGELEVDFILDESL